jgi:hypothetical protein
VSLKVSELVWEHSSHKGSEKLVHLAIARYCSDDGTGAWPSLQTLADDTGLTSRSVQTCLQALNASGELITRADRGPRGCNLYAIPLAFLLDASRKDFVKNDAPLNEVFAPLNEENDMLLTKPASPDPSIDPSLKNLEDADSAGAREGRKFQPIPKGQSARKRTEHPTPQRTSPSFPTSDGLADIHVLQADPLLWLLTGKWVDLAGRVLELLTVGEGEHLVKLRGELGDTLTQEHIEQAASKSPGARVPVRYFEDLLRKAAAGKLNDRPAHTPNGHITPSQHKPAITSERLQAMQSAQQQQRGPAPPKPRAPCRYPGCSEPVHMYPGAKFCREHGAAPTFQQANEIFKPLIAAAHR